MAEIFLYTPEANINSTHLEALRKNGFVPVKVANFGDAKVLPVVVDVPQARLDLILRAACDAFAKYPDSVASKEFGALIATRLLAAGFPK